MATAFLPFRTTTVRSCANSVPPNSDFQSQKGTNPRWWTPLFSWSSEPDYFDSDNKQDLSTKVPAKSDSDLRSLPTKSRIAPGCFTEEKARKLRLMTKDTAFHDAMYHSVIASRLAFDRSDL